MTDASPSSLWFDEQVATVSILFPLPFSVRIDMLAAHGRIAGKLEGKSYTLETSTVEIASDNDGGSTSVVYSLPQRACWRIAFGIETGTLSIALVSVPRSDLVSGIPTDTEDNEIAIASVEFAIRILNQYLRAYSIAAEDPAVRTLTPEAFDSAYVAIEFSPRDGTEEPTRRSFGLPAAVRSANRGVPDDLALFQRIQHGLNSNNHDHPMDDVILWRLRAEHHADYVGDYELAIVALQTSVERRVYAMRSALLADQGANSAKVAAEVLVPFKTAFNGIGATLHGGSWDLTNSSTPVGRYWTDLYQLRNEITHDGASVSRKEAESAFAAHDELVAEIERRLLERKTVFPRTTVLCLGAEGLRQRGSLSNRMQEIIRSWKSDGEDWSFWLPFDLR